MPEKKTSEEARLDLLSLHQRYRDLEREMDGHWKRVMAAQDEMISALVREGVPYRQAIARTLDLTAPKTLKEAQRGGAG